MNYGIKYLGIKLLIVIGGKYHAYWGIFVLLPALYLYFFFPREMEAQR